MSNKKEKHSIVNKATIRSILNTNIPAVDIPPLDIGGWNQKEFGRSVRDSDIDKKIGALADAVNKLGEIVNGQGRVLSSIHQKMSEMSFRAGKTDQQLQIFRNSIREVRDALHVHKFTLVTLGIVNDQMYGITSEMMERKALPVTSSGRTIADLTMTRYGYEEVAS